MPGIDNVVAYPGYPHLAGDYARSVLSAISYDAARDPTTAIERGVESRRTVRDVQVEEWHATSPFLVELDARDRASGGSGRGIRKN